MERRQYVNSPAAERRNIEERRENHSQQHILRGSNIYLLVGVSFGLLCVIQVALNVLFWQQAVCSNRSDNVSASNFTVMSAGDIRLLVKERDQLVQTKDQLVKERDQVVKERDQVVKERDQLVKERDQLVKERDQLVQTKDQLVKERDQLVQTKDQVVKERDQVVKERDQVVKERDQVVKERDQLLIKQQNQIKELEVMYQKPQSCPPGWHTYMSTCYQRSSTTGTWDDAADDCESKGSHLVILNDEMEEENVRIFGCSVKMWIGLTGQRSSNSWMFSLVDGRPPSYTNWNNRNPVCWSHSPYRCAYVAQGSSTWKTWFLGSCYQLNYWMCEMRLHTNSALPR